MYILNLYLYILYYIYPEHNVYIKSDFYNCVNITLFRRLSFYVILKDKQYQNIKRQRPRKSLKE